MHSPHVQPAHAILALSLAVASACAQAQGVDALPLGLRIVPSMDVSFSLADSSLQTPQGQPYARSGDIVTLLRPGVEINGRLGRTRLYLSYGLDLRYHSRPYPGVPARDNVQNVLNSKLSTELVDRWLFLDANAVISQQAISAFGQQTVDGGQYNTNRTETAQFSLNPYARGVLGELATYRLGLVTQATRYKSNLAADSHSTNANLDLASASQGALLGWGLTLNSLRSGYSGGTAADNQRVIFSLLVRPDPELSGSLRAGAEKTTIGSVYSQSTSNWGGDLRWTPSPRTTAGLSLDERYFGRAHQASFEHRMASSSIRLSSSRSDNIGGAGAGGLAPAQTTYELFAPLFVSITDPALRDQKLREFLALLNLDPNQVIPGSYANRGSTVLRRDEFSFAYGARRLSFSLQVFRGQSTRQDVPADSPDAQPIRQYGLITTTTYRLTPTSNLSLTGTHTQTQGVATQAGNRLNSVTLNWAERLGPLTTVSVNGRYSVFDGPINPYHESSLGASLGLRF